MKKFEELFIEEFRGIRDLSIKNMTDVNVFVGENNVGKTSILEALYCFRNPSEIDSFIRVSRLRLPTVVPWNVRLAPFIDSFFSLFNFRGENKRLSMSAKIDENAHNIEIQGSLERQVVVHKSKSLNEDGDEGEREIEFMLEENCFRGTASYNGSVSDIFLSEKVRYDLSKPIIDIFFVSPMQHLIGGNITEKTVAKKDKIVELLSMFDDQITGFDLVRDEPFTNRFKEVIHHKSLGVVPLYIFGDGLKRVLSLATNLINCQNGVLLIDEIETSIHISILPKIFKWFISACRELNVQVFIATHSMEALKILTDAAIADEQVDMAVYRIEKFEDKFYSKRFGENELDFIINDEGQDVR